MMRHMLGWVGCLGVLVLAGCGGGVADAPDLAPATGTVLVNDKPIADAMVTFSVEGKPIATGATNAEGKFTLTTGGRPGAPIGTAKVTISKVSAGAQDMTAMKPEDMMKMQKEAKGQTPGMKAEIPAKYADAAKSGLTADVGADGSKNVFEYRLND